MNSEVSETSKIQGVCHGPHVTFIPASKSSSATINVLMDELLYCIFEYLPFLDRQSCMLVSKKWYEIITRSRKLSGALQIEHCVISEVSPPWTILETSSRPFFHAKLGSCITLGKKEARVVEFANLIKGIETLTVTNDLNDKTSSALKMYKMIAPVLHNLKELELPTMAELFELKIPETVEFIHAFEGRTHFTQDEVNKLANMKNVKKLGITWLYFWNFGELPVEYIKFAPNLDIMCRPPEGWWQFKAIKCTKAFNLMERTTVELHDVEQLGAKTSMDPSLFEKWFPHLQNCINLNKFATFVQDGCFFLHRPLSLNSVKMFFILDDFGDRDLCSVCIKNVFDSFPNLKEWGFSVMSEKNVRKILDFKPSANAAITTIQLIENTYGGQKFSFRNWPVLENVKTFQCYTLDLPWKEVKTLFRKLPNLEKLTLYAVPTTYEHLRDMSNKWQKMKELEVNLGILCDESLNETWIKGNIRNPKIVKVSCKDCRADKRLHYC